MSTPAEPIAPHLDDRDDLDEHDSGPRPRASIYSESETAPAPVDQIIHEYDGVQEYDNDLPKWWLYALYATMIFGLFYYFHYEVFRTAQTPAQLYHADMQSVYAAEAARLRAVGAVTPALLTALSRDDATVRQGRETFVSTCAQCHLATGAGNIGPNLTDGFWLHGGAPDRVYRTISEGVPTRGMPAWGSQLGADRIQAVTAFLITIKNTNVTGRAPQGTREP